MVTPIKISCLIRSPRARQIIDQYQNKSKANINITYFKSFNDLKEKSKYYSLLVYELPETINIPDPVINYFQVFADEIPVLILTQDSNSLELDSLDSLIDFFPIDIGTEASLATSIRSLFARHEAEIALRYTSSKLQVMQKELDLAEISAGLAHDANNMLSAVLGELQLLNLHAKNDETKRIARAISGCKHVAGLMKDLLSYCKETGNEEQQVISSRELIDDSVALASAVIAKDISVKVLHAEEVSLLCHRHQIEQVLHNMVINAAQAIEGAGEIRIKASSINNGSNLCIEVIDTGKGIPADAISQIFNPFFSTKRSKGGSGLGLAMSNRIIYQHGGEITVNSTVGVGTCFRITLPANHNLNQQLPTKCSQTTKALEYTKKEVLLIDDSEDLLEVMSEFLTLSGITSHCYSDPNEAIKFFEKNADQVGIVLLDLHMPNISGEEVFYTVKATDPDTKIVLNSGDGSSSADKLLNNGALAYLQKPLDYEKTVSWILEQLNSGE